MVFNAFILLLVFLLLLFPLCFVVLPAFPPSILYYYVCTILYRSAKLAPRSQVICLYSPNRKYICNFLCGADRLLVPSAQSAHERSRFRDALRDWCIGEGIHADLFTAARRALNRTTLLVSPPRRRLFVFLTFEFLRSSADPLSRQFFFFVLFFLFRVCCHFSQCQLMFCMSVPRRLSST